MPPTTRPKGRSAAQRAAEAELARRARLPAAVEAMLAGLFPTQRAMVSSEARRIVTCTGRRGGKTHALTTRAVRAAQRHPKTTIPVFERTQTCAASRVFWRALQDLNERFSLQVHFHHSLYIATLTNGAEIIIVGADTADAADKARGGHYPEAIIDEAGTFRAHILEYLLQDVLSAALFDHGGTLVMSGTPGQVLSGPFYEACHPEAGKPVEYERHHWTALDNLHIPYDRPEPAEPYSDTERAALRLAELERELGVPWAERHLALAWKRREWLGEWVVDNTRCAYRIGAHNVVRRSDAPEALWSRPERYVWGLGLDLGYNDPTAFVVEAVSRESGERWVVESYEQTQLTPSAVAAHVERLRTRFRFAYIVADTGGYGKGPAAEMASTRWNIPIIAAAKRGKEAHRTFCNGDLASGRTRVVAEANRDLIADLQTLRLNEEGKEDERDANHLPDAFLYIDGHLARAERGLGDADSRRGDPASAAAMARLERDMERMAREQLSAGADDPNDEGVGGLPYG